MTPDSDAQESAGKPGTVGPASVLLLASVVLFTGRLLRAQDPATCPAPFVEIARHHPIDDTCGAEGHGTSEAQKAQNRAKNNFCATGEPAVVTTVSFRKLQAAAGDSGVSFGSDGQLPDDRSALRKLYTTSFGATIGEGDLVTFVAFVLDAHYSNAKHPSPGKKPGESVNCNVEGEEDNDIHIMLGTTKTTAACQSVTAEMIPHERPDLWTPDQLNSTRGHPVRIVGQLFFDASHRPCTTGKTASPARVSLWEIHPVYAVDVCSNSSLSQCSIDDAGVWTPLHQFDGSNAGQDPDEVGPSSARAPVTAADEEGK